MSCSDGQDTSGPLAIFQNKRLYDPSLTCVNCECAGGYYGPLDVDSLAASSAEFISANSDGDKATLSRIVGDFLTFATRDCTSAASRGGSTHSCWLSIRMTLPTNAWAIPRWHTDGRMFSCTCPDQKQAMHSKYAVSLIGPATRVMSTSEAVSAIVKGPDEQTRRRWDTSRPNEALALKLRDYPEAEVDVGQIIRFSWGQFDSPVHSEPDVTDLHRVFISVLFAAEPEIRDMCRFRGTQYGKWFQSVSA